MAQKITVSLADDDSAVLANARLFLEEHSRIVAAIANTTARLAEANQKVDEAEITLANGEVELELGHEIDGDFGGVQRAYDAAAEDKRKLERLRTGLIAKLRAVEKDIEAVKSEVSMVLGDAKKQVEEQLVIELEKALPPIVSVLRRIKAAELQAGGLLGHCDIVYETLIPSFNWFAANPGAAVLSRGFYSSSGSNVQITADDSLTIPELSEHVSLNRELTTFRPWQQPLVTKPYVPQKLQPLDIGSPSIMKV